MALPSNPDANPFAAAVEIVGSQVTTPPQVAIILGSGLGGLADTVEDAVAIPFEDIPGCGRSSAGGHRGQLILGKIESTPVVAMAGRLHRYEGWSHDQVVWPVRLMSAIGASTLIVSNAAGGLNPKLKVGDIVIIRDHINRIDGTFPSPPVEPSPGLMRRGNLYDPDLCQIALRVGVEHGFDTFEGTYLATLGPNYETRSEYRMMRRMGADVAGMSTVPEVLAASAEKMRVLGLSMVSNVANPDQPTKADHSEVLEAGRSAAVKMEAIVREVLRFTPPPPS